MKVIYAKLSVPDEFVMFVWPDQRYHFVLRVFVQVAMYTGLELSNDLLFHVDPPWGCKMWSNRQFITL